ncbi:MAG: sigma-70 family RNA polymerase sigma factor [Gemmatimonadetes bacterium]|nr:sigma-70 family RNA polymerase sigma factor [Gemmatimonadota bacterium]
MSAHAGLDLGSRQAHWTVVRAQAGDRAALDRLLRAIQSPLFAHIAGIVQDRDTAKDVLQDTLLLIAHKLNRLRDPRLYRSWCYRIATREAVRRARTARRWVELTEPEMAALEDAAGAHAARPDDDRPFDADLITRVPDLIATLTPAAQAVVRMHYLDGLTLSEIAEALEAPLGTIKSRLACGLDRLRTSLASRRE